MELLEYVLRNATLPGPSEFALLTTLVVVPLDLFSLSQSLVVPDECLENENDCAIEEGDGKALFLAFDEIDCARGGDGEEVEGPVPDDPPLEMVSKESVPTSIEELVLPAPIATGSGGTISSPGAASIPFFLAYFGDLVEVDPPRAKRPFALGADATRRMKRVMDLGVSRGPE